MDRRKLRFPEYDGERLTVRLSHEDRQRLRQIAGEQRMTESDLVREAVAVLLGVIDPSDDGARATS